MTTYRAIASTETDPEAPITSTLMKALQGNVLALGEQDTTVPMGIRLGSWHLGTMVTTSGSTQTLSGLDLTGYKFLTFSVNNVSTTSTTSVLRLDGFTVAPNHGANAALVWNGLITVDLSNSALCAVIGFFSSGNGSNPADPYAGRCSYTTATTSITFSTTVGTFDLGSIRCYGVK